MRTSVDALASAARSPLPVRAPAAAAFPREASNASPRVLLVKTSSLGDVVANLPVVTDIIRRWPDAQIDWVVEEAYVDVPRLHRGVAEVIAVAQRRWRRNLLAAETRAERQAFIARLRANSYDLVIDTQGLLKSALIARRARGPSAGYDWASAREPLATLAYDRRLRVQRELHAIERNRRLAAAALGYTLEQPAAYALTRPLAPHAAPRAPYCVLVHGSSRPDKLWPEERWIALGAALAARRLAVVFPWGSDGERERSRRIAASIAGAVVPERLTVRSLAGLLAAANFVVGVDTGPMHLAAALRVPVVGMYFGSDPRRAGIYSDAWHRNLGGPGVKPEVGAVVAALGALAARWRAPVPSVNVA